MEGSGAGSWNVIFDPRGRNIEGGSRLMENNERLISGADERTKMTGARYKSIYRCANTRYRRANWYRRVRDYSSTNSGMNSRFPRSLASLSSRSKWGERARFLAFLPDFFRLSFHFHPARKILRGGREERYVKIETNRWVIGNGKKVERVETSLEYIISCEIPPRRLIFFFRLFFFASYLEWRIIPYHRPVYIGICLVVAIVSRNRLCEERKMRFEKFVPSFCAKEQYFFLNDENLVEDIILKFSRNLRTNFRFSPWKNFLSLSFFFSIYNRIISRLLRLQRKNQHVTSLSSFLKFIACLLACRVLIRFILWRESLASFLCVKSGRFRRRTSYLRVFRIFRRERNGAIGRKEKNRQNKLKEK